MKSTFVYTQLTNVTQYSQASFGGQQGAVQSLSWDAAKKVAEGNPAISYICRSGSDTTDTTFFSGEGLWLGSRSGASTSLVAEVYDTSDADTRSEILGKVRDSLWIDAVDTRGRTSVTMGIVFCEFSDISGGGAGTLPVLTKKLLGPKPAGSKVEESYVEAFVRRESNGRVTLSTATYSSWVTLAGTHTEYLTGGDLDDEKILAEVDEKIEFPAGWDIVALAFPEKDVVTAPGPAGATLPDDSQAYAGATKASGSYCLGFSTLDAEKNGGRRLNVIVVSPQRYLDVLGTHMVTTHEVMHALGLPDIYHQDLYRSYGWSIMSAAGAGRHITGYEKLALGWEDLENFVVLKRGLLPVDDLVAPLTAGRKGVIVLPDGSAGREDIYVVEPAQEVGLGQKLAVFNAIHGKDRGLLAMIVRADKQAGHVIPFVAARPGNVKIERDRFGGASQAPFTKGTGFTTNGIITIPTPGYATDRSKVVTRVIGVVGGYTPPASARKLRENERIAVGSDTFMLSTSGALRVNDAPCVLADGSFLSTVSMVDRDYGFCVYVEDASGDLCVAAALEPTPNAVVRRLPRPPGAPAKAAGKYSITIEKQGSVAQLVVYAEKDDKALGERKYAVLAEPASVLRRGWRADYDTISVVIGPDGNVVVRRKQGDRYLKGSAEQFTLQPDVVTFDAKGNMTWLDEFGHVLRTFPAVAPGTGPFVLAVEPAAGKPTSGSLIVRDSANKTVSTVFTY